MSQPAIDVPVVTTDSERKLREQKLFRQEMGSISRQSSFFLAGTVFTAGAAYFFKIYIARALGAEALGTYSLGITIVSFFGLFCGLGLPQSAARFISAYNAGQRLDEMRAFLGHSARILLIASAISSLGVLFIGPWIVSHFYRDPALKNYLGLFVGVMLTGLISTFLGQVLAGYKDVSQRTVISSFIGSPLNILCAVVLISLGYGLRGYILAQVIAATIVCVLLLFAARQHTPAAARNVLTRLPRLPPDVISFSGAAWGMSFLEVLLAQGDKVLIGIYLTAREVGVYALAAALVSFLALILQSVNQIFAPVISDLFARGEKATLQRLYQTLTKWILGLTLPLAGVVIILAVPLMRIFGKDFESGWVVLVIGSLGQLINCAAGSVGYLLFMSGHQSRLLRVQAVVSVFMVLANLALIPKLGIVGAALAASLSIIFSNIWLLVEVKRKLDMFPYNRGFFVLLPSAVTMVLSLLVVKAHHFSFPWEWMTIAQALVAGYVVFIATALAIGLDEDDRMLARNMLDQLQSRRFRKS